MQVALQSPLLISVVSSPRASFAPTGSKDPSNVNSTYKTALVSLPIILSFIPYKELLTQFLEYELPCSGSTMDIVTWSPTFRFVDRRLWHTTQLPQFESE